MKKYMVIGVVLCVMIFGGRVGAMSPLAMSMSSDDEADGVAVVEGDAGAGAEGVAGVVHNLIDEIDVDGDTQLHKAVKNRDVEQVQRLLLERANPNLLDAHGHKPFYYACMQEISRNAIGLPIASEQARQQALVRSLYLAGADDAGLVIRTLSPYVLDSIYRAGLDDRVLQENSRVFCGLSNVENPLVSRLPVHDVIAIVKAYVGVSDGVQNHPMRARIANVFCKEDSKKEAGALFNSCAHGDIRTAIKALYVGADINSRMEYYGRTALQAAVIWDRKEIVRLLLEKRASLDIQAKDGRAALQAAVIWDRKEIVRLLLENRAISDMQDNNGETALHTVVKRGEKDIVRLLLEHGASVTIKDKAGKTPLDVSRELKQRTCVVS